MEINGITSLATNLTASKTSTAVEVTVLKKALDIQSSSAIALINAIPNTPSSRLPPHLGQNINTTA